MFDLLFLGTSASAPSIHRGLSSHLVQYQEYRFLIDCGEGTQRQILQSGVGFRRINRILLTHDHLDHILGLGGLLSTLLRWESTEFMEIYGGRRTLERVKKLLYGVVFWGKPPEIPIRLITVEPGPIFADDDFTINAFPVIHRGAESFGYIFEEQSRCPFLADKADALGVPFGPERATLVRGEVVALADGRVITPDQVLGPPVPGIKYAHVGDAGDTASLRPFVHNANTLVIEASYAEQVAPIARDFGHLTAMQAARLAAEQNVKSLILTHFSRRTSIRAVLSEAKAIFPETYAARDLDRYQIGRDRVVQVLPQEQGSS